MAGAAPGARGVAAGPSHIAIRGARVHNLRDVDVDIPRERLVVITGLSGSGKSSLAFDTLYAEGQRRYVESLSAYARQFLEQMAEARRRVDRRPLAGDRDRAEAPAGGTRARPSAPSPRSTTTCGCSTRASASRTAGRAASRSRARRVEQMAARVLAPRRGRARRGARAGRARPEGRVQEGARRVRAPGLRARAHRRRAPRARRRDPAREVEEARHRAGGGPHRGEASRVRARIAESLETALRLADGLALVEGDGGRELLSRANACATAASRSRSSRRGSSRSTARPAPASAATGSAAPPSSTPTKLVPDADRPLGEAIAPWGGRGMPRYYRQVLAGVADALGVALDTPWRELPARAREQIVSGTGAREIAFAFGKRGLQKVKRRFDGVLGELERRREDGDVLPEELLRYARPGAVPGVRGHAARPAGAAREARRARAPRARARSRSTRPRAFLDGARARRARAPRWPTACCARSASGCASCATWASAT